MIMMMVMMILVKPQDAQGDKSCKPGLFLPRTRHPSWRDPGCFCRELRTPLGVTRLRPPLGDWS